LSVSLNKVGDVLAAQGKGDQALAVYQQSREIAQKLAQHDPTNTDWQRDLSVSLNKVGDVLTAQGKGDQALAVYQQSREIAQKLAQHDPTNSTWQGDLSEILERVGNVLAAQGDLAGALKNYRDYLAITEKLASQDPTKTRWQNNAAWSRYCIAKVLMRIKDGDRNEARHLVVEGIDIMTRLQHQGALNTNAQDTLNKLNELAAALNSSSSG
jgi:tetratricopeptide (TPR) repeat protein